MQKRLNENDGTDHPQPRAMGIFEIGLSSVHRRLYADLILRKTLFVGIDEKAKETPVALQNAYNRHYRKPDP